MISIHAYHRSKYIFIIAWKNTFKYRRNNNLFISWYRQIRICQDEIIISAYSHNFRYNLIVRYVSTCLLQKKQNLIYINGIAQVKERKTDKSILYRCLSFGFDKLRKKSFYFILSLSLFLFIGSCFCAVMILFLLE